ncbi:MAG: transcriptional regulator NrdR [Fusobacterium sp.]|uniref:transcriptional regulator NrdR n=1 Tax=Fusobacterium sp. TaxID=68766 RepID=UPI003F9F22B7
MKCPFCSSEDTKVVDSRTTIDGSTKRRRECNNCFKRFSTYERFEESQIYVVKKDNRRVKYDRGKLLRGLTFATVKRNISREELDKIISDIERGLQNSLVSEISSKELGEKVLEKLRDLDQVAYVRFASVYKEFDDIKSFIEIVEQIKKD